MSTNLVCTRCGGKKSFLIKFEQINSCLECIRSKMGITEVAEVLKHSACIINDSDPNYKPCENCSG